MTDFSHEAMIIKETICAEAAIIRAALTAPHVLHKPRVFPDGTQWCALLGDDLMSGVVGFGDTPAEACEAFDKNWRNCMTPKALQQIGAIKEEEKREAQEASGQFGMGA